MRFLSWYFLSWVVRSFGCLILMLFILVGFWKFILFFLFMFRFLLLNVCVLVCVFVIVFWVLVIVVVWRFDLFLLLKLRFLKFVILLEIGLVGFVIDSLFWGIFLVFLVILGWFVLCLILFVLIFFLMKWEYSLVWEMRKLSFCFWWVDLCLVFFLCVFLIFCFFVVFCRFCFLCLLCF